eukprot:TRINITY_DN658_c0_g1_i1.p1 TRINITY_DN658_c0_g1~~TRINITY_DN658_c0_g1_i1.p1  ORF type:complete len:142 (+),score=27.26 TRINITY_DN658_c0_g1_i1:93-518(+)
MKIVAPKRLGGDLGGGVGERQLMVDGINVAGAHGQALLDDSARVRGAPQRGGVPKLGHASDKVGGAAAAPHDVGRHDLHEDGARLVVLQEQLAPLEDARLVPLHVRLHHRHALRRAQLIEGGEHRVQGDHVGFLFAPRTLR